MSKESNFWDNNISPKHKKRVADALGIDVFRIVEMDMKLADVGKNKRIEEAKRKCAEKWAKREEELNKTTRQ